MTQRNTKEQGDTKTRTRVEKPRMYKVLLYNDDYTTMEFVVFVLETVFRHGPAAATRIMLSIHKSGVGVAGVYTKDIAETRVDQVLKAARENGHPLQCTMEPE
jgi:ATP-dependent Clp protease adaptor protein ClpS